MSGTPSGDMAYLEQNPFAVEVDGGRISIVCCPKRECNQHPVVVVEKLPTDDDPDRIPFESFEGALAYLIARAASVLEGGDQKAWAVIYYATAYRQQLRKLLPGGHGGPIH